MAILKIRDADGNIQEITAIRGEAGPQGEKGDSYVLTDADKQEIADLVNVEGTQPSVDLSNYYTKEETDIKIGYEIAKENLNDSNNYYTKTQTDTQIASMVPKSVSELENDMGYADIAYVDDTITARVPQGLSGFTNDMGYVTAEQVQALLNAVLPVSGDEVSY